MVELVRNLIGRIKKLQVEILAYNKHFNHLRCDDLYKLFLEIINRSNNINKHLNMHCFMLKLLLWDFHIGKKLTKSLKEIEELDAL